jgi:chromosome segregation ATPase
MATLQPNKNLTPTLTSDLEALRDDLNRARQLAAEAQSQVDGRAGDIEALQVALQKSFEDLSMLRNAIDDLRRERHFFANEAMRSAALEIRITDLTIERDDLRAQLTEANEALDRLLRQVPAFP